ncbi:isoprenylcysteine carboxylmethyltransferase family protein [Mycoplasmatota bacterium]|nr:isoprenylcysteine carboxylmethyltransferase family protein [Mycoplasmatota bacterium]
MEYLYLNGFLLLLPILFIRYGILGIISKEALTRAHFEPNIKRKYIQRLYNLSMNLMFITLFFYKIRYTHLINHIGFVIFILGFIFYLISTINFSNPHNKINTNGLYKISRNPMYVGFFIYFLGVSLILESIISFILLLIYQFSCHTIIKSEENWCIKTFGEKYLEYMKKVRRYL